MITWLQKHYNQISKDLLYDIIRFRIGIFMIEQNSIYEDLDELDQDAVHFIGMDKDDMVAYGRVHIDPKTNFAVICRICVHKGYRDQKLGSVLMNKIMAYIETLPNLKGFELEAQQYLQHFYEKFGFQSKGAPHEDGGILHIRMTKAFSCLET